MRKNFKIFFCSLFYFLTISSVSNSQVYCTGDSINLTAVDYITGDLQWQYSYNNFDWNDIQGANSQTYMFYPTVEVYLRLKILDEHCLPAYFTNSKHIIITQNATIANAGNNQLNIPGTNTQLEGNYPAIGTGTWSILAGINGVIEDMYDNTSVFSGLPGETYILRWVIYNACSYTFDEVSISFAPESFICGSILTDPRDNKQYSTVQIGTQCWMAENLNIGVMINGNSDPTNNNIIEKYCYGNNENNCNTYGGLYSWDEMMQYSTGESIQGICPPGWHIPSDEEIKVLEIELGMTPEQANINNNWRGQGVGTEMIIGGNSGFNMLFGGARNGTGGWMYIEGSEPYEFGYLYTTTEHLTENSKAFRRCLMSSNTSVGRYDTFQKTYSFSVRCLKD